MRTLKQNSGSYEHLSQYHVLMCVHYCRLCILNMCGCCMYCTHYYCHTHTRKWTNTSPLPYSPPCTNLDSETAITFTLLQSHCSHAHAQEHGTLTHPRNELGIRKSWGGLAAIQTNYVILLWRWGHHRSMQNSSSNPQGNRKRGPEAPQCVRDVRCRQGEAWQNMGVVWRIVAKDESELQSTSSAIDYRQRSEESVDDFVTRARTEALKCDFQESELEERIIELKIASTPVEAFQRELLGKAKGYKLTDSLAEGRRFEAILAGRQEIQKRTSTPLNNVDQVGQACGNCGRAHPPRVCPAYKDSCKFWGKIGHWNKFCWKCKETNRPKEDVQQRGDTKPDGKQHRDAGKGSCRRDRRFHDLEPEASYTS